MSGNILSMVQGIFGATLYHCKMCRFQFHDFRSIPQEAPKTVSQSAA